MPLPQIPEPDTGTTDQPDAYTATAPDYTEPGAPDRVFFINLGVFRYGTKDKAHGASVLFGLIVLILIIGVVVAGFFVQKTDWVERVFNWLGNAFLFISGVAVGRNRTPEDKADG